MAEELGNVSKACQIMGLSRDTFWRYRDAVEDGGVEALLERPRRAPNLKNRVDLGTEKAAVAYAVDYPAHRVRVSNELRRPACAKPELRFGEGRRHRVVEPRGIHAATTRT